MKEVVYYQCEACGAQYEDQKSAYECERNHSVLATIVKKNFFDKQKYPYKITLKFGDNQEKEYYSESFLSANTLRG